MILRKAAEGENKVIKALYTSAFPRNERAPYLIVKRRAMQNRATMLVAEEQGEFIGSVYTVEGGDSIYLLYFAVAEDKRGCGNGSEILRLLKEYYKDKKIFLAREPLDDAAENNRERIRRRGFYIKNGFVDLPFRINEANVIYDLMSTDEKFNPSDYNTLIQKWAGKAVLRFVKMKIAE